MLERFYNESNKYEFALDEAGRGCLFGRVYIACVVLPKDETLFDGKNIKDSKKFSSKKKINEVAEYIKENALAWHISYKDEKVIDDINILNSTMRGMHDCLDNIILKLDSKEELDKSMAIVDGNYFIPYSKFVSSKMSIIELPHVKIEKGDGKYMAIAAASILAKTARDAYIEEMCKENPYLIEHYGLNTNMGYGTKKHLDGIREHGITEWHRKTFGDACKNASLSLTKES
jgi:ribonuclease HII